MIKMASLGLLFLSSVSVLAMDNDEFEKENSYEELVECCDEGEGWGSYLASKRTNVVVGTAKFVKYAYEHPKVALYMGLCCAVTYGIPAVAAVSVLAGSNCTACSPPCDCFCGTSFARNMGKAVGLTECRQICNLTQSKYQKGGCFEEGMAKCLGCFPCNCRCGSSFAREMGKTSGLTACYQLCNQTGSQYQGCY